MKQFGSFRLDTANQCLLHDGVTIAIPPKPFAVLRYLVENPGRLITHDELLDALWPETYVQPQILRTYMLELRKLLCDDAGQPRFIQTLPKRGYCFVASVVECDEAKRPRAAAIVPPPANAPSIIGRENDLAQLAAQFELLANGERRLVFICGEAGIGKTALVDAFCRQVDSPHSTRVARGQCVQGLGCREEYYPVTEALSQLWAPPHGEAARRILSRMAPAWLTIQPEVREPEARQPETATVSITRAAAAERTLGDLCGALEELAADLPLVLIFEDLDWADDSTLNLISALARRRAPAKLMLLATYRSRKSASDHAFKAL